MTDSPLLVLRPDEVMSSWRPGSADHSWADEFAWLITHDPRDVVILLLDVAAHGVRNPIVLGDDGRVWDGHHRILAAHLCSALLPTMPGHTVPITYEGISYVDC